MASQPNCSREWLEREEQAERREEAMSRKYRRQQFELFDELMEDEALCPNCGAVGFPAVYGVSSDASTGYYAEEQGCTSCLEHIGGSLR
jgi:hypothetical protein